ncbi:DUF2804 domain-containing protein [Paenisporosarcina cavernae]|uniref:DUF2804 domain-containing protein n=1 Tax=Paenisporosarcina cavernae TaxID=2320858 RepID=A0A385YRQ9_9BACL|nr:DUF2804 domain-containing protein [Paenisporosarcina cavernae]AYC28687.1 DUF2804 domain-containing protein [Paenisporosarcina cavernae]
MKKLTQHAEREITSAVSLCDTKGDLNPAAIGFARKPIIHSNLKGHFLRKKKWNYWCIFGEEILFSATISHLDYAAVCFVYFLDYETQRFFEKTITIPVGRGVSLPSNVLETVSFSSNEMSIQLVHLQGETHLTVTISDFDSDFLHADLHIEHPADDESLNVVIPWNRQTFQHTAKHHSLPTRGFVKLGDRNYRFRPEESFAVLDYGRGVWPRSVTWNWAMGSQRVRGQRIGINFGGKWTDGTGMTENAIFVDGKMTKLSEDVIFTYNPKQFMDPWKIHTKFSSDVQLTFTPFFERVAQTNAKVIVSTVHQLIGYFNGTMTDGDGKTIQLTEFLGSVEEHVAKW